VPWYDKGMPSPHPAFCARVVLATAALLLLPAAALPAQGIGGHMRELRRVYGPTTQSSRLSRFTMPIRDWTCVLRRPVA